jgi:hypothetical protein
MTAVEWIFEELENKENGFPHLTLEQIYKQAKEMEKQQRGYNEEDMRKCWMACLGFNKPEKFNSRVKFEQWFETFSK